MEIYKALISFTDAHLGKVMKCDVIQHDGSYWIVPEWQENTATKKMSPERIIQLDTIPHQKTKNGKPANFIINQPIPFCVFSADLPSDSELEFNIIEKPDISFDSPQTVH